MPHLVLLGDSIFDNARYTGGRPEVVAQVREIVPAGWKVTLLAVDGSTTEEIPGQLAALPADASHLVLSVGGNDAICKIDLLEEPVASTGEALLLVGAETAEFEQRYRAVVDGCQARGLPLVICTIYHGHFENEALRRQTLVGLTLFNDAILRTAIDRRLPVIDLRYICNTPADYANPIEPSSVGGAKIARAVVASTAGAAAGAGFRIATL